MPSLADILPEYMKKYEDEQLNPPPRIELPGAPISLSPDHRLVVIGAMPGAGKTAYVAGECSLSLARQGYVVVILSYEMSATKILQRILANIGRRDETMIDERTLSMTHITAAAHDLWPLAERIIIETPRTIQELHRHIDVQIISKPVHATGEKPRVVLAWDYLQRVPFHSDVTDPRVRAAKTLETIQCTNFKYDAKSLVISSLKRDSYYDADLSAFKEAGDIESDADMAIQLHLADHDEADRWHIVPRERINEERKKLRVFVKFEVVKNRHGQQADWVMEFIKPEQRFVAIDGNSSHNKKRKVAKNGAI
ncbi:DnaB-like helicase C-terminal domain-containing protein [Geobacter anodireducens]|nr:DnaB-like helicase C-terminal domain-containing protein [Geobacter anodireducens]